MTRSTRLSRRLFVALAACSLGLFAGTARAAGNADLEKPIKTLVQSVRYSKDELALKSLDGETQGQTLLGADWQKGTAAQREEFVKDFHELFSLMAFPKIRENFQYLETTLYEPAKIEGEKAGVVSTLVIQHPIKGRQELKVRYDMHKQKDGWKVADVTILGTGSNSMLTDIRNDQVQPLLKQGGWDKLLGAMRERLAQLKKK